MRTRQFDEFSRQADGACRSVGGRPGDYSARDWLEMAVAADVLADRSSGEEARRYHRLLAALYRRRAQEAGIGGVRG